MVTPVGRWILLVAVTLSVGCRNHRGFQSEYQQALRPAITAGDWKTVAARIEANKGSLYSEEDRVMFWLDHGTALHYAGDLEKSSSAFFSAEEAMQELFTKSISEEIGRFVATETIQTYPGEDYERSMSYVYTTLNAAKRGRMADALVEARRADGFLKKMQVAAEKAEADTSYTQDAFLLWWVGLLLEVERSYGDALLAYEAAYRTYDELYRTTFGAAPPGYLLEDIVRTARLAGRDDAVARWTRATGAAGSTADRVAAGDAELILIHATGEAPVKREATFTAPMPDGYIVRVAVPALDRRPSRIASSRLVVAMTEARSSLAQPVEAIAMTRFQERIGGIQARAVARAATKYVATKATSEAVRGNRSDSGRNLMGMLVGIAGNIASAASEGADLRSWTLLPAQFRVARMWLPPGTHDVRVDVLDAAGRPSGVAFRGQVQLAAGERQLLSVRSVR